MALVRKTVISGSFAGNDLQLKASYESWPPCIYAHIHTSVYSYVCVFIRLCIHTSVYSYVCVFIRLCIHTSVYSYVCVFIRLCIHRSLSLPAPSLSLFRRNSVLRCDVVCELYILVVNLCVCCDIIVSARNKKCFVRIQLYRNIHMESQPKCTTHKLWLYPHVIPLIIVSARNTSRNPAGVEPVHWKSTDMHTGSLDSVTNWKVL